MPEASQYIPSLKWENMEAGEWERTEGGREALKITVLSCSLLCGALSTAQKKNALFPVICASSFFLLPRYLLLFYTTPEKMGDVKGNGGVFLCLSYPFNSP